MKPQNVSSLENARMAIAEWLEASKQIDFQNLDDTHYWYVRSRVSNLVELLSDDRNMGNYRQMIFSAFLDLLCEWKNQLAIRGYDYRLELWIVLPAFEESQVIASIKERKTWYKNIYTPVEPGKPFPVELFISEKERVSRMNWAYSEHYESYWESYYIDSLPVFCENDYDMYLSELKRYHYVLDNLPYETWVHEGGRLDKLFYEKTNDVWIGQLD